MFKLKEMSKKSKPLNKKNLPFFNRSFDKKRLKLLFSWYYANKGESAAFALVETLQKLGFTYAMKAGISLGVDDLKVPSTKGESLLIAVESLNRTKAAVNNGNVTALEEFQQFVDTWHRTSENLKTAVVQNFTRNYKNVKKDSLPAISNNSSKNNSMLCNTGLENNYQIINWTKNHSKQNLLKKKGLTSETKVRSESTFDPRNPTGLTEAPKALAFKPETQKAKLLALQLESPLANQKFRPLGLTSGIGPKAFPNGPTPNGSIPNGSTPKGHTQKVLANTVVQKTITLNPVYMMAFSGARGNLSQVRQLVGMRGLMADPQGQLVEFPIQSNFREGLTVTEYMISCYGARKGLVDTALRTAAAGYLTRRLVDVSHHQVVRLITCGTKNGICFPLHFKNKRQDFVDRILPSAWRVEPVNLKRQENNGSKAENLTYPFTYSDRLTKVLSQREKPVRLDPSLSRPLELFKKPVLRDSLIAHSFKAKPLQGQILKLETPNLKDFKKKQAIISTKELKKPLTFCIGRVLARDIPGLAFRNQEIDISLGSSPSLRQIYETVGIYVRSPLTCRAETGICQLCYGWSVSANRLVGLGEAVGIIAAQSIGEPGTQLTMRTFHTGGVFSGDIMEECRAKHAGLVNFAGAFLGLMVRTSGGAIAFCMKTSGKFSIDSQENHTSYTVLPNTLLFVRQGEKVVTGSLLAQIPNLPEIEENAGEASKTISSNLSGEIRKTRTFNPELESICILAGQSYVSIHAYDFGLTSEKKLYEKRFLPKYTVKDDKGLEGSMVWPQKNQNLTILPIKNKVSLISGSHKLGEGLKINQSEFTKPLDRLSRELVSPLYGLVERKALGFRSLPKKLQGTKTTLFGPNQWKKSTEPFIKQIESQFKNPGLGPLGNNFFNLKNENRGNHYPLFSLKKEKRFNKSFYVESTGLQKSKLLIKLRSFCSFNLHQNIFSINNSKQYTMLFQKATELMFFSKQGLLSRTNLLKSSQFQFKKFQDIAKNLPNQNLMNLEKPTVTEITIKMKPTSLLNCFLWWPVNQFVNANEFYNLDRLFKESFRTLENPKTTSSFNNDPMEHNFYFKNPVVRSEGFPFLYTPRAWSLKIQQSMLKSPYGPKPKPNTFGLALALALKASQNSVSSKDAYETQGKDFLKGLSLLLGPYNTKNLDLGFQAQKRVLDEIPEKEYQVFHKIVIYNSKLIFDFLKIVKLKKYSHLFWKLETLKFIKTFKLDNKNYKNLELPSFQNLSFKLILINPCWWGKQEQFTLSNPSKNKNMSFYKVKNDRDFAFQEKELLGKGRLLNKTFSSLSFFNGSVGFSTLNTSVFLPKQSQYTISFVKNFNKNDDLKLNIKQFSKVLNKIKSRFNVKTRKNQEPTFLKLIKYQPRKKVGEFFPVQGATIIKDFKKSYGSLNNVSNNNIIVTQKDRVSYKILNNNSTSNLEKKEKPSFFGPQIGCFVNIGDELIKDYGTSYCGQIIEKSAFLLTLRFTQNILYSNLQFRPAQVSLNVKSGKWLNKGTSLVTLPYISSVTGDIVAGIPKIEQLFEARGEILEETIEKIWSTYQFSCIPKAKAVRECFKEIGLFVVTAIQSVYSSQGVHIADKHLEVIIRQMTRRALIIDPGDTEFLSDEFVDLHTIESVNWSTYGISASYQPRLIGITKSSLTSNSFLSSASFQQTARVLERETFLEKTDRLLGLKERVMMGALIDAGTGGFETNVFLSKNNKRSLSTLFFKKLKFFGRKKIEQTREKNFLQVESK